MHVAGPALAEADLDQRADDRAHQLPAERVAADLVAQHAVALVDPARLEHAPRRRRSFRALAAERREVVLADERIGAQAQRAQVERLGHPPREAVAERIGHGPVEDRVAVRAPRARSGVRRTAGRRARPNGSRPRARASSVTAACSRHGSSPGSDGKLATWPHACTPASVRPAHASSHVVAQHLADRVRRARRRPCARPGWPGCAANPLKSVPSYATTSFTCAGPAPVLRSRRAARRRRGSRPTVCQAVAVQYPLSPDKWREPIGLRPGDRSSDPALEAGMGSGSRSDRDRVHVRPDADRARPRAVRSLHDVHRTSRATARASRPVRRRRRSGCRAPASVRRRARSSSRTSNSSAAAGSSASASPARSIPRSASATSCC